MLLRNKRFNAQDCYGWGKLLLFATTLSHPTRELYLYTFRLPFCGSCLIIFTFYRYELLFYPRYHLDQSSLLYQKPLLAKPMVMDVYNDYLLVTYHPFDVHIYHVKVSGDLTPSSNPDIQVYKSLYYIVSDH